MRVGVDGDKVIVDLGHPVRDVMLSPLQAYDLAAAIREAADLADRNPPSIVKMQWWEIKIESYDGKVCLRLRPPFGYRANHFPLPREVARRFAAQVEFKAQQAAHKMRFKFANDRATGVILANAPADADWDDSWLKNPLPQVPGLRVRNSHG